MKLRIGIDYRLAANSNRGMGRYCREMVDKILELDKQNEYCLIIDTKDIKKRKDCRYILISKANFIIGEQILIPFILFRERFDYYWSPHNTFPLIKPRSTRLLVTVHDLIYFYRLNSKTSFYQKIGRWYRKYVLKFFKQIPYYYFTVSSYSKNEMINKLKISQPIEITYNCIENFSTLMAKKSSGNIIYDNYFFTVSGDAPSKNLDLLIRIMGEEFPDEKLIIAGVSKNSRLRICPYNNIIFLPPNIKDEELIQYYLQAKCFLFFSLYEGFGIPLLEAAVCKKPILASNTTSIPEILGDLGVMTSPNYKSISDMIRRFLNKEVCQKSVDYEHLAKFKDWRNSAKVFLKVINP